MAEEKMFPNPTAGNDDSNRAPPSHEVLEPLEDVEGGQRRRVFRRYLEFPYPVKSFCRNQFGWVPSKINMSSMKPVIRSVICGWISLVLFLVPNTEVVLGDASFLILMAAVLSPPHEPFITVLRRELKLISAVCLAWAWNCFALVFADLARPPVSGEIGKAGVFSGEYANQFTPNAILLTFMSIGGAFFVYLRARFGPGPYAVFGCICTGICFTTSALFPYSNYRIGQIVVIPLAVHVGISLFCAAAIFPESVNAQFIKRMVNVLKPLSKALKTQPELLKLDPFTKEFNPKTFQDLVSQAEASLIPLLASSELLKQDFSYGRFSGKDLTTIHDFARKLTVRCDGLSYYFHILDPTRVRFPKSHPASKDPRMTNPPSKRKRPLREGSKQTHDQPHHASGVSSIPSSRYRNLRGLSLHEKLSKLRHPRWHLRSGSLRIDALVQNGEQEVGVFESLRYMNIEAARHTADGEDYLREAMSILGEATSPLILACAHALDSAVHWLESVNHERLEDANIPGCLPQFMKRVSKINADSGVRDKKFNKGVPTTEDGIETTADSSTQSHTGEEDTQQPADELIPEHPPHLYLLQSFAYHFHLLELSDGLMLFLNELEYLTNSRRNTRIWFPSGVWKKAFRITSSTSLNNDSGASVEGDDDDPSVVEGLHRSHHLPEEEGDEHRSLLSGPQLNPARSRDPDAYPPTNTAELLGSWVFGTVVSVTSGNVLFAIKIGALTALIALPHFLASSAGWAYERKWVWSVIMVQLTSARFKGETAVNFIFRIFATLFGGITGLVLWYISAGNGRDSPYGLAAACLVFFPMLFIFRVYYPGSSIITLITCVTVVLVFGYSYKDTHDPAPGSPGFGWDVAWRRFVGVVIGVTAAFIFSFLPPTVAVRRYQRVGQSTVMIELGTIMCSVISNASSQQRERQPALVKDLIAIRSKIRKLKAQSSNASYEFSLRGKWPAGRYTAISTMQFEIAYLLTHLYTVVIRMDGIWVQAFLARTRLLDPDFLGRLLTTITMCSSSLKTGVPLPQITAAPLIDGLNKNDKMIDVIAQETELGLPTVLTAEVLRDEQYMCFCVGVASVYSLVRRLDRLMFAIKELVGENFHVDGVEIPLPYAQSPGGGLFQ
ncbi:hypothetical protein DL93DRAFT_2115513 [Clavulina sp. PMI_390]|nr:hypothetical protein DL93DRAFT_2115513 [Clavulina sp. PMI_390]